MTSNSSTLHKTSPALLFAAGIFTALAGAVVSAHASGNADFDRYEAVVVGNRTSSGSAPSQVIVNDSGATPGSHARYLMLQGMSKERAIAQAGESDQPAYALRVDTPAAVSSLEAYNRLQGSRLAAPAADVSPRRTAVK